MRNGATYRIVVGVDGSSASKAALLWAVWFAELVHGRITAPMAWDEPTGATPPSQEDLTSATARVLADAVDETVADNTVIEVRQHVVKGNPAKALLDAAETADLLVVGSHGVGGFMGLLLGSVSQQCTQHATCPVVVVRNDQR